MSLSAAQLLIISEALHDKCALAENVDFVFPTATRFTDKADYWAFVDSAQDTQTEIETELIRAVWISRKRFEYGDLDSEYTILTLFYEITLFNESTFERKDETDTPDAFNAKVGLTDHEHDAAVLSIDAQFGHDDPIDLLDVTLADCHTKRLAPVDDTQRNVPCEFIVDRGVIGSLTKFDCQFITRLC